MAYVMQTFQVRFLLLSLISVDLSLAQSGYDADISKLVDFTGDVVREKLTGSDAWIMWAIAQRASLELKIDAWLE
jgi:hypothetical protein